MVDALDGYLHPELLGGGMSRVYRATRRRDGRVVAVKSVGLASEDVAWAERRGAELQRQFHAVDARVPDVLDIRTGAHELLIEMEYIDGEESLDRPALARPLHRRTTRSRSRRRSPTCSIAPTSSSPSSTARPTTASSTAISSRATSASASPRKPAITTRRRSRRGVRVLDFGVAKGIRGAAGETRNVFGSAPYMSPERLIDGHVSTMSDCWSLGVVLCELLAGAPPFQGSERDVLRQIDGGPPVLPADCPGDLVALVHRLLARDPAARLTSAGEARDALRRWRETTRRTSPLGADAAGVPPLDVNPTRRTEAGIGHAPTSPISGARAAAADPRDTAAGAAARAGPISGYAPVAGNGSCTGGETRRTQPQLAVARMPLPPIPPPVWADPPPIPVPSGPTARAGRMPAPGRRVPWPARAERAGAGGLRASSAPPPCGSSSGARGRSAARCACGASPICSDARSTRRSPRPWTRWSRPTAR